MIKRRPLFGLTRLFLIPFIVVSSSCKRGNESSIVIHSPRELTAFDKVSPHAPNPPHSSAAPVDGPAIKFEKPDMWTRLAPTGFRLLNFAASDGVEVYLGQSNGEVLPNVNRWLSQFGQEEIGSLNDLQQIPFLKKNAYLVEAVGDYKSFGASKVKADQMLMGLIMAKDSSIITVKMTGPRESVKLHSKEFINFCESIKYVDNT